MHAKGCRLIARVYENVIIRPLASLASFPLGPIFFRIFFLNVCCCDLNKYNNYYLRLGGYDIFIFNCDLFENLFVQFIYT
jgi:hypothetical protein